MSGFNDLRCESCRAKIGFFGEIKDCPPCPKCGKVQDIKALEALDRRLSKAREEMLADLEKDHQNP